MYSILIVEDERIVAKDLQQTLVRMGYDAFAIASSAEDALSRASERCPDLVLMDIRIRGKRDGIETAALLRDRFGIPIVYLTAHTDEATLERAKKTEPYGYLMKPVRSAELRSVVEVSIHKHQMELRHRERERSSLEALSSTADAVISVDPTGNVSFLNQAAETLAGIAAKAAIGQPVRELLRLLDRDRAQPATAPEPAPGAAPGLASAPRAPRVGGDRVTAAIDPRKTTGAIVVFRDAPIPARPGSRGDLAERLASLGTLAAGLAHEVNTPLAIVIANASYVLEELREQQRVGHGDPGRAAEAIQAQRDLESAALRIGRIVTELQAFSGPAQNTAGETEVGPVVEAAVRSTAHEFRDRGSVVTNIAAVPRVKLDPLRLEQILVALLVNAAHATQHSADAAVSVVVRVQDDAIAIEVRDSGCGMAPDVLARIFEPFYTTKATGGGAGLGLAVCHGIVTAVGGRIEVDSRVGLGSMFRVTLPAVIRAEPPAAVATVIGAVARRGRLLVIDDEPMMLTAIKRMLRDHDVVCLDDARQAVEMLDRGEKFDVIFSDLMMPNMTGMELYERLLSGHAGDAHRIVFVTGGAVSGREADFLSVISNVCLLKPVSSDTLRSFVQTRLDGPSESPGSPRSIRCALGSAPP